MKKRLVLAGLLLLLAAPARAGEPVQWNFAVTQSRMTFTGTQMGKPFTGTIQRFTPDILFDPETAKGRVAVDIDISSIATGDKDRDKTMHAGDFFDTAHFPAARFAAKSFKKTGPGAYEAEGTLTIRNISVPVTFPFTLDVGDSGDLRKARMKARVTLDRSAFGLGRGAWTDTGVIGNEVTVDIDLEASRLIK